MLEIDKYEAMRTRPSGSTVMNMKWRDLAFAHFSVEPHQVQRLLPEGLTVDTFEDKAWVGVVPLLMKDVRPAGLPAVPGADTFPEFNVRTYVHRDGVDPGLWFFSLDAANMLAVQTAKLTFGLPYYQAEMSIDSTTERILYKSRRKEGPVNAWLDGEVTYGGDIYHAEPGTLEFFLIERYLLYARRMGKLVSARVFHAPYPLQKCEIVRMETSLTDVVGLPIRPWEHAVFSGGVDVDVFAPRT